MRVLPVPVFCRFPVRARACGLALLIGTGLLLSACGGESGAAEADETVETNPEPAGVPAISFARLTHDFGAMPDTDLVRTSFAFSNTGTGKLVISDVKASCGCTVPTLQKSQLLPGESSALDVIFDPAGRAGPLSKKISVVSNAQPENVVTLTISAQVEATVRVEVPILNLGNLPLGREHRQRFGVFHRHRQVEISELAVDYPHVTARLVDDGPPQRDEQTGEYRTQIEVVIDADAPWGAIDRANLTFRARRPGTADADGKPASYRVLVVGALYGDLRAEPRYLASKTLLTQGQLFAAESVLTRLSGAPFAITDIRVRDAPVPDASARYERINDHEYRILLEGTAPNTGGGLAGSVALRTDVPGEEDLVLQLSAYVKK